MGKDGVGGEALAHGLTCGSQADILTVERVLQEHNACSFGANGSAANKEPTDRPVTIKRYVSEQTMKTHNDHGVAAIPTRRRKQKLL